MNWYKVFYWMSIADNIKIVMLIMWVVFGIYTMISTFVALGANNEDSVWSKWEKGSKRVFMIALITFISSIFLWTFIPSKKDCMLIIAGGSVGSFISSDSSAKALPADLTKYLHLSLNKELNDLGIDTKKELGLQSKKEEMLDKLKDFSKEQLIDYLQKDTTILK